MRIFLLSLCIFIFGYLLTPLYSYATDFSSDSFILRDPVFSGGGGRSTSGSFELFSSFSQPAVGVGTSDSRELRAGFLYFPASGAVTPPPAEEPPPPPSGTGSGSVTTPIPAQPPLPPFPPLITELLSPLTECVGGIINCDFNCDGTVDLKDLSVLLTKPRILPRTLSLFFSDWTARLPIPVFVPGEETAITRPAELERLKSPELAQVVSVVSTTTPPAPRFSIFKAVAKFFKTVWQFILRLFGF